MGKQVAFKTNARHISQLGRELVTDFVTALVELVKNSYDADAAGVKIIFENVKKPSGRIIIVDVGTGMTQQDIETKWTVIGTNNKVREPYSKKGRKYAGKKGIGRFAVERLAEKLTMYSFNNTEEPFKFEVNWNKYEEINIPALKQRLNMLRYNKTDIDSAKYIKSHIDYFLNNELVDDKHKDYIKSEILNFQNLSYELFMNDFNVIDKVEKLLIPIFDMYQNEEIRISEISNEINILSQQEISLYREYIYNLNREIYNRDGHNNGLILVLEGLRDEWKQKEIMKLEKELRVLVSPDFLNDDPFKIKLVAPEFELQNDIVMNNILDLHYAKVTAYIKGKGTELEINYNDKNGYNKFEKFQNELYLCGDLDLELYYFIRDQANLSNDIFKVKHARDILDEFCGIKIYRNGFHVKPYGDVGNDWLFLDKAKIKETHGYLVGNNQVIGIINISEENNPLLVDATNREGIIENEAYSDLRKFVLKCTDLISNIRYEEFKKREEEDKLRRVEVERRKEEERRLKEEKEIEMRINESFKRANDNMVNLLSEVAKDKATEIINMSSEVIQKKEEAATFYKNRLVEERKINDDFYQSTIQLYDQNLKDKERELSLYKDLAALGMLTGAFGHETKDIISRISSNIEYTKVRFSLDIPEDPDMMETYEIIENDFRRIKGYSKLITNFLKKDKREDHNNIIFGEVINDVCKLYSDILNSQNIEMEFITDKYESEFPMYRIDLESVIINMITNSFEALKGRPNKVIRISTQLYENYYEILFEDNGKGIKDENLKNMFLPFNTTKEDGIGLGLCIVKDVVERYKGQINVINSSEHGGAVFSIKFPRGG